MTRRRPAWPRGERRAPSSSRLVVSVRGRFGARRRGRAPRPARRTRRRARLASCRAACGDRSTIGAISSNGMANMSCSTNESRSGGVSVSSTTSSARPTESVSSDSCSGSVPSSRLKIGSGTRASRGSSRRAVRERGMSRHTRDTPVVNHACRFSTPVGSARLRQSQASCTASSASLTDRASGGRRHAGGGGVLGPLSRPLSLVHGHIRS